MLSSFTIKNFRSIIDLHIDFSYGEGKAPNGYKEMPVLPFLSSSSKNRYVPCMAFFGANASGKSNVLMAFQTLQTLVSKVGSNYLPNLFEPNLLNRKYSITSFEIEFTLGTNLFNYHISYTGKGIEEEVLSKDGDILFHIKELNATFSKGVTSSAFSKRKLIEIFRVQSTDGESSQIKPVLHLLADSYPGLSKDISKAYTFIKEGLLLFMNNQSIILPISVNRLASVMNGDKESALRDITEVVRKLDIDISDIKIIEKKLDPNDNIIGHMHKYIPSGERYSISIKTTHKDINGNDTLFDFMKHESSGTQHLAGLIGFVLYVLKTGNVLFVDELECSIHPLIMREIVLLFKYRAHNPNGAQLIFSTHNTDILDDSILRMSEIALLRKTVTNGTLVRRLVDARNEGEDIRNVTNFRSQYLAGFYSGIPHPAL